MTINQRLLTHFLAFGQKMATYYVILFRYNHKIGMLVRL